MSSFDYGFAESVIQSQLGIFDPFDLPIARFYRKYADAMVILRGDAERETVMNQIRSLLRSNG